MGKIFLNQWNAATTEARYECALLLDMPIEIVEEIMAQRMRALVESSNKKN